MAVNNKGKPMVPAFQHYNIHRIFSRFLGDIDISAYIDTTLTLPENIEIVRNVISGSEVTNEIIGETLMHEWVK